MKGLEREYGRNWESLCRSADGPGRGGSPERAAAEMDEVDPAVERLIDWNTDEGACFYLSIQDIAKSECRKKNASFAEAVVEASTYATQKRYLEAAIECRKNPEFWRALQSAETVIDDETHVGRDATSRAAEKRKMVLDLIPYLHDFEETLKKCEKQTSLIASGRARTAFKRRFGTKEKRREDGGDFDKIIERHGGGAAIAYLQQEALVAEIDRDLEENLTQRAEQIFDGFLKIEKHLSSKDGVERKIYNAIRAWRMGRAVMAANKVQTGRPQDIAAAYYGVSGDLIRSRSKELQAWARFVVGDPKRHQKRFARHLRNVERNLGTRSSRNAFYHSLIALEETFLEDWNASPDKACDRFRQLAFDSELKISGNPLDVFQRERWKARMDFLNTLSADALKSEQGIQR